MFEFIPATFLGVYKTTYLSAEFSSNFGKLSSATFANHNPICKDTEYGPISRKKFLAQILYHPLAFVFSM